MNKMSKAQAIKTLTDDTHEAHVLCIRFARDSEQDWDYGRTYWFFDDESAIAFDDVSFWVLDVCDHCNRRFSREKMVQFHDKLICSGCELEMMEALSRPTH